MPRNLRRNGATQRNGVGAKYDAHHNVLTKTYGALADLRRELSDSKAAVAERTELLKIFSNCQDSQRAWLLLEDYFEKLSLSRKDFTSQDWWPRLLASHGHARLEETAILFLRANRPLPPELLPHANLDRFAEVEQAEQDEKIAQGLEQWLSPHTPVHLEAPRATLRILCSPHPLPEPAGLHGLKIQFLLFRARTGEKERSLTELCELTTRATHEQELFAPADWNFIQWVTQNYGADETYNDEIVLKRLDLLQWLAKWGDSKRLELAGTATYLSFAGSVACLKPHLTKAGEQLEFTNHVILPGGKSVEFEDVQFFHATPELALIENEFYLLRNAPSSEFLGQWAARKSVPVRKLSHRLLTHLRRTEANNGVNWEDLCSVHLAKPQFIFELSDETIKLRLVAQSERDQSMWHWTGHEWQLDETPRKSDKPEILDDTRAQQAAAWLRRLDWFTPEPGLWVGDANENFLAQLAANWNERPQEAEYLGNPAFHRLFLQPRRVKPHLMVKGSGIDWFSVSADWEVEGLKLTSADLAMLQNATSRFVKLPDAGWLELDVQAVEQAHEAFADLGIDGLSAVVQKLSLEQAAHLSENTWSRFADSAAAKNLRSSIKDFSGVPETKIPDTVEAELRPYQTQGFDFLCHLSRHQLGGILADDMGLGKTLQTLTWLSWLFANRKKNGAPALVICPASVLHNWRREANKFTPHLKVLVLESGAARHNLRKQIPQHDIIVTNYALLRRDLEALQKFSFSAMILDEAQFIKNPGAQITQCVKKLRAEQKLALTGTPLENRLLDLWSIVDFVQPGYLGSQDQFSTNYEPSGPNVETAQRIARRRLSARLRPIMLRRLKRQVAKDLPERIEERRDCDLGEAQRKLYLAELRRSREQIMNTVAEKGLNRSKIHVLAALTRLRQICCHPTLVGNDSASGKTETLFELLEPLLADNQKVLVFSQFVQMLKLLEAECVTRGIPTHMLTGETKDRQQVVNNFQGDERAGIFLLSLKAAGTGLNLTSASYVILYDPWWNPAVEAQAIDRSHRIGQTRTVNAYRLIAPGTVEEKIWELQQKKAQTIADVLGEEGFAKNLSQTDLEYLFSEE